MATAGTPRVSINLKLIILLILGLRLTTSAQTTIWSDDFNNGCAANCLATTHNGWTVNDNVGGTTGSAPNNWFVSCAEDGIAPPGCGSSCVGDASLHIGANPAAGGDMGASFNETGATNATFRRAVSPTINTTGFSSNTLSFDFIAFGSAACSDDRAQLQLSTDNGATWPAGFQYCLTSVCCGACNGYSQGQWTTYTMALPAAFDNNPNIRIGFHWRNNGNGSGTDPSVAIDDVRITTVVLPADILNFKAHTQSNGVQLTWSATRERMLNKYEVQRATELGAFKPLTAIPSKAPNAAATQDYNYLDVAPAGKNLYYRLRMIDHNGGSSLSKVIRVTQPGAAPLDLVHLSHHAQSATLTATLWTENSMKVNLEVVDMHGKTLLKDNTRTLATGENPLYIDTKVLADGIYFLNVSAQIPGEAPIKIVRKFQVMN